MCLCKHTLVQYPQRIRLHAQCAHSHAAANLGIQRCRNSLRSGPWLLQYPSIPPTNIHVSGVRAHMPVHANTSTFTDAHMRMPFTNIPLHEVIRFCPKNLTRRMPKACSVLPSQTPASCSVVTPSTTPTFLRGFAAMYLVRPCATMLTYIHSELLPSIWVTTSDGETLGFIDVMFAKTRSLKFIVPSFSKLLSLLCEAQRKGDLNDEPPMCIHVVSRNRVNTTSRNSVTLRTNNATTRAQAVHKLCPSCAKAH